MADNSSSSENTKNITVAKTPSSLMIDEETAKQHVAEFEEMFQDRFTEKDEEFVATTSSPVPPPPCVQNFFTRQKRSYDRSRPWRRGRGGYHGDDRDRGDYRGYRDRGSRNHPYGDRRHDNRNEQGSRYHPYQDRNRQYHDNRNEQGSRYHHDNRHRHGDRY